MVAQRVMPYVTLEEYFTREDAAETKSEYYDGIVVAMSGATTAHVRFTTNITWLLGNQLESGRCEPFNSDLRVYAEVCNTVFYPDLTVVCGTPQFANTTLATLLNPTVVIEVLSKSTERVDRGFKFDCYRSIPSLAVYVMIAQMEPRIEVYSRQGDGSWRYDVATGLEASITLPAVNCVLPLADVYARVEFPPQSSPLQQGNEDKE